MIVLDSLEKNEGLDLQDLTLEVGRVPTCTGTSHENAVGGCQTDKTSLAIQ